MVKKITLFFTLIICTFSLKSQNEMAIYYTPTALISGDLVFNLEFGLPKIPNSRFMISPKLRLGVLNTGGSYSVPSSNFSELSGANGDEVLRTGLELMHRMFLIRDERDSENEKRKSHSYFSYGLGYTFAQMNYSVLPMSTGVSGVVTEQEAKQYATIINTADLFCQVGKRFESRNNFVFDLYFGVRYRKSMSTTSAPEELRDYERGFLAPKYSGVLPTMGFRAGIFLNKFSEE